MAFIIGDKKEGYDVVAKGTKVFPWVSRVWDGYRIARHDSFKTRREAVLYCHGRYSSHRVSGLKIHERKPRSDFGMRRGY